MSEPYDFDGDTAYFPNIEELAKRAAGAAIDAMKPYMEPGEMSVGIVVNVQHLAATPEGHKVTAYAEVTKVDGRRVEFIVRATDEMDEIGTGRHSRAVADRAKFDERLKKKIKQA